MDVSSKMTEVLEVDLHERDYVHLFKPTKVEGERVEDEEN